MDRAVGSTIARARAPELTLWRPFALAMGWVALAILDFERHRLAGLVCWYHARQELSHEVAVTNGLRA